MSRITRRLVPGAALLLAVTLTAGCGSDDGADTTGPEAGPEEGTPEADGDAGETDEQGIPEPRGPELEIDHGHPYTVRIADAYFDPNPGEGPTHTRKEPAPADHTYLHLLVAVEGVDETRELPAPPHGSWEVYYTGCEEYALTDTPDACESGSAWPIGQASDYLTVDQAAEGEGRGLGNQDNLEAGETYYKSVWWTVAEDHLPEDAELCEASVEQSDMGAATGNCVPVGDIRASPDAA